MQPAQETPSIGGLLGILKDAFQGACSGLLGLLGATHMTGAPVGFAELNSAIPWVDAVWGSISAGGLAGPAELLGAATLFFATRRTISRTVGLLLFIGFIAAYSNGYSASQMLIALSDLLAGLALHVDNVG